ncbi:two-component regulator propeller domain-containing protein [Pontibacter sp. G13]|uniref:hybrid sensor histidine kinase/response regulator transcription factor n=1 Tax=Pontibacter sp. G13 TaxID=3074898 RepID=UPI00288B4A7C|nr:two-component regulator propeller domain-containing protein [Pontibacter sp. G13]WNJ20446.1 two-component regulator propeller domain-containing protein [Pontibacter sp. G13]
MNRRTNLFNALGFILMLLISQTGWGQLSRPFFKHLTVEDGLSNNWVKSIVKDQSGYMWFGTFNGLNRYDGTAFRALMKGPETQLTDNFIESMAVDRAGNLWVGTFSFGLNRFDPRTETFTQFTSNDTLAHSVMGNRIKVIYPDRSGRIWLGTDYGLEILDPASGRVQSFKHDPQDSRSITPGLVTSILEDKEGVFWIGTKQGLNRLDASQGTFTRFLHDQDQSSTLSSNDVTDLYQDKYGDLWIGTWGGGLNQLNLQTGAIRRYLHSSNQKGGIGHNTILALEGDGENLLFVATEGGGLNVFDIQRQTFQYWKPDFTDPSSINSNSIHALYFDSDTEILWAGSYNGGVNYFSKWDKPFLRYRAQVDGLNNNHVTSLEEDDSGQLWIGTDGGGVNILNPQSGAFRYIGLDEGLQNQAILSLLADREGRMWVGTYDGGIDVFGSDLRHIDRFTHDPNHPKSLSGRHVNAIYQDLRGLIWIGTMSGGLNLFDPDTKTFTQFQHRPNDSSSLIDNFIYGIFEDRLGRLLVQTGKGLEVFDYRTLTFSRFNSSPEGHFDIPGVIMEDSQGNLWVGSKERGLFRVDRTGVQITTYTEADGLPSNSISGILEDASGNLWISTHRGLCKFEEGVIKPERKQFHVFSPEDGLQGSEFKRGAYCQLSDGTLAFGGQYGFNLFDPKAIRRNPFVPPVEITEMRLFNKPVDFREGAWLNAPVSELELIELDYQQTVITFEFSALNYLLPERNQFAYMLDGFEDIWNYVGSQNHATYTNLDPGTYTFHVKASNNDGVWNQQGTTIKLRITPPWWELLYVKILAGLLLVGLVLGYFRMRTIQLKRSKRKLERKVAIRTADLKEATTLSEERRTEISRQNEALIQQNQELEEQARKIQKLADEVRTLNEAKLKFFTSISHELRTPLNLILWPLEEMIAQNKHPESTQSRFQLMWQNARTLTKLINQLLDFRKMDSGSFQLRKGLYEVVAETRGVVESFHDWAQRKQLTFHLQLPDAPQEVWVDWDHWEKILSNLISNACKYAPDGGNIWLDIQDIPETKDHPRIFRIMIWDDGPGIAEEQRNRIFDRFYEGGPSGFASSGIGLALVKELVELQGGSIELISPPNQGACFEVRLPILSQPQDGMEPQMTYPEISLPSEFELGVEAALPSTGGKDLPTILIVEDHADIRNYMRSQLESLYQIVTAANGKEGCEKALKELPDLVISDVMMPEMDGFELCKTLKEDDRTSHIPVILVTARSGEENLLAGLSIGADDYIAKPFSFQLLQLKIQNLFFTRAKLISQLSQNPFSPPEKLATTDRDRAFLKLAEETVRDHLSNSNLDVETFCEPFGMGRRNVLRKMKALTGLSINEYIRHLRLNVAHQLLESGEVNVSEAAYEVGFTDPKYFSNCFKKQFGILPKDLKR